MVYVPSLVFGFVPKVALLKVLCRKAHCHGTKSTCPAFFTFFKEITAVNIPKLAGRM
jgi:hypothetical protein